MKTRFLTAVAMLAVAFGVSSAAKLSTVESGDIQGVWATTRSGSVATVYADERQGAVLGFYQDQTKADFCDFAIAANKQGVYFQLKDKSGKPTMIPVSALLKLAGAGCTCPVCPADEAK